MTNRVFGFNEKKIINGNDMKPGDFGKTVDRNASNFFALGICVFKADNNTLIDLSNGYTTDKPEDYEIELKDKVTLQRS